MTRARRLGWLFAAPVCGLAVYLVLGILVVRVVNRHLPEAVLAHLPLAPRVDESLCASRRNDPVTPAGGSRLLGVVEKDTVDDAVVFVFGFHDDTGGWSTMVKALDEDFRLQGDKVLAFFPCFPTHDMGALAAGAAQIHEALAQVPPTAAIHLVGFSMGGLVIKHYLRRHMAALDPARIDVVTINTPHHGTPSFFLGYATGDPSVVALRTRTTLDPLAFLYGDNPVLAELADPELVRRFRFYTIAGSFVASPVNAFLGGAWLAESDGMVPSRSAHVIAPRFLDEAPSTYLDGLPYHCAVHRPEPRAAGMEVQFTFFRPLYEADLFHSNVPEQATTRRLLIQFFRDEVGGLDLRPCTPYVEPLDVSHDRPWMLGMLALPLVGMGAGGALLGRRLGALPDGLAVVLYGAVAGLIAYTWSGSVPQHVLRVLEHGHVTGVALALVTALVEELWVMLWFAFYLRQVRRGGTLAPPAVYVSGMAFGLMVAMVEQLLYVWTTIGALPGVTLLRLLLATVPRVAFGALMAWVFVERARLAAAGAGVARARALLLVLPFVAHALYSTLTFHSTTTFDAIALYLVLALGVASLLAVRRARAARLPT